MIAEEGSGTALKATVAEWEVVPPELNVPDTRRVTSYSPGALNPTLKWECPPAVRSKESLASKPLADETKKFVSPSAVSSHTLNEPGPDTSATVTVI